MSQAEALQLIEDHLWQVVVGVLVLAAVSAVVKGRGKWDRLVEEQARQRAVAASLGLRVPGRESRNAPWDRALAALSDGPEKLGRFPRVSGQPRIVVLFEGEHRGMRVTIAQHTLDTDADNRTYSTLACFASPEIGVSEFELTPLDLGPPGELDLLWGDFELALKWLGLGGKPRPPMFPGRSFDLLYKLETNFAVSIRDDFDAAVLDFFETHPGWRVEGAKGRLLVWREHVAEPAERIPDFLSEAAAVAQVFRRPPRTDA